MVKAKTARKAIPRRLAPPPAAPRDLIYSALNLIMAAIQPIIKSHTHADGFDFSKIDDITAEIRPLLITHHVLTIPHEIPEHIETVRGKINGEMGIMIFTKLKIVWRLYALDGSFVPATTWGEGMSEMHFSTAAAQTMSFKAMLEKVFVLPLINEKADPQEADLHGGSLIETPDDDSLPAREMETAGTALPLPATATPDAPITKGMLSIIKNNLANNTAVTALAICQRFGIEIEEGEDAVNALARLKKAELGAVTDFIRKGTVTA